VHVVRVVPAMDALDIRVASEEYMQRTEKEPRSRTRRVSMARKTGKPKTCKTR
jgi:hypothetical protein